MEFLLEGKKKMRLKLKGGIVCWEFQGQKSSKITKRFKISWILFKELWIEIERKHCFKIPNKNQLKTYFSKKKLFYLKVYKPNSNSFECMKTHMRKTFFIQNVHFPIFSGDIFVKQSQNSSKLSQPTQNFILLHVSLFFVCFNCFHIVPTSKLRFQFSFPFFYKKIPTGN